MKRLSLLLLLAIFSCTKEPVMYTLTTNTTEGGAIFPPTGEYEAGTTVVVSATPDSEYLFTGWSGYGNGDLNPLEIVINSDISITANFVKKKYPLTINIEGQGTVSEEVVNTGKTTDYYSGSVVKLTAIPNVGWKFVKWTGSTNSTEQMITLNVNGSSELTAIFEKEIFTLNVSVVGSGVVNERIIQSGRTTNYVYNSKVELTAIPNNGWRFKKWIGDVEGEQNPVEVILSENLSTTAEFEKLVSLNVNIRGFGSYTKELISGVEINGKYSVGSEIKLTPIPENEGEKFVKWDGDFTSNTETITVNLDADKSIFLNFKDLMVYAPDDNFEAACANCGLDSEMNDSISLRKALKVRSLSDIINAGIYKTCTFYNKDIADFTGLEAFRNIESLNIGKNYRLNNIDLSPFSKLRYISSQQNRIETYDFSLNPNIESIYLYHNGISPNNAFIKNIIFSNTTNLKVLSLTIVSISNLDLSQAVNLEELHLRYNYGTLTNIDVSNSPKLQTLRLGGNVNLNCIKVSEEQLNAVTSGDTNYSWTFGTDTVRLTTSSCNEN